MYEQTLNLIRSNLTSVIKGKDHCIEMLLAALLARGHVLIEDMPGLGKTTLAKAVAKSVNATFRRIQFTPDLLPSDILGGSVYNPKEGTFTFHKGAIFTNVLLADEINRASPRTQSSLLEAMAERQVTIDGTEHHLNGLFWVIATQNPIEFHGTYPLPEAQLDRFLIRMELGYASVDDELTMLFDQRKVHPLEHIDVAASVEDVIALQDSVMDIHMDDALGRYIVDIVHATRDHERTGMGASPRGGLGMFRLAQAFARLADRDHVLPEDIQSAAGPVLTHRIMLETKAKYSGTERRSVIEDVIDSVKVPT